MSEPNRKPQPDAPETDIEKFDPTITDRDDDPSIEDPEAGDHDRGYAERNPNNPYADEIPNEDRE